MIKNIKYTTYTIVNDEWRDIVQNVSASAIIPDKMDSNSYVALNVPDNCVVMDLDFGHDLKQFPEQEWQIAGQAIINLLNAQGVHFYGLKTNRGYHLYFRNDKHVGIESTGGNCALGLHPVDYKKTGAKMTICKAGTWRNDWISYPANDTWDTGWLSTIPNWLLPAGKKDTITWKQQTDRNATLLNWLLLLNYKMKLTEELGELIATFINEKVFGNPMRDNEVAQIVKSALKYANNKQDNDALDKDKDKEWRYNYASALLNEFNVIKIGDDKYAYDKDEGYYSHLFFGPHNCISEYITNHSKSYGTNERREIMDTLANLTRRCGCTVSTAGSYIKVNNGLLDQHGKLVPATPLIFSKVRLNCDYDPLAYNAYVDKFLNQLFVDKGDVEQRMIFEEFLGTILFDKNDLAKTALVLCGGHMKIGSACKSKLTDTLKRFLGTDNYQSVPITALTPGNNKDLCAVASCICNFDDDTFEGKLNKGTAGICKKLIGSSDDFNIKPLYGESIKAKIKLKFFCTANEFPESELFEKPLFDRFVILGCYNKFPSIYNEVPDNDIVAACTDQQGLSYLLKLAMNGWLRYCANGKVFTKSKTSSFEKEDWMRRSSLYVRCIDEIGLDELVKQRPRQVLRMMNSDKKYSRTRLSLEDMKSHLEMFYSEFNLLVDIDKDTFTIKKEEDKLDELL